MGIHVLFLINLGLTILLGIVLLVLPFVFRYKRKKYLERERSEL